MNNKMNSIRAILLWLVLSFACFCPAFALTPSAPENHVWQIFSIRYDAPATEVTDLGNRTETSISNYDTAPIQSAITEEIPTEANRAFFGQSPEFKAADTASTVRYSTGSGAGDSLASGSQQALNDTVMNNPNLSGVKLTQLPTYDANLPYFGEFTASGQNNFGVAIGPKAFTNETELVGTIVHEETHLRFFQRLNAGGTRTSAIDAAGGEEDYVRAVEARYLRMKGLLP